MSNKSKQISTCIRRSNTISINIGSLEDLLNKIDQVIKPHIKFCDKDHWSHTLNKEKNNFINKNSIKFFD